MLLYQEENTYSSQYSPKPCPKGLEKQGEADKILNVRKKAGGITEDMFLTEGTLTDFSFRLKYLSTIVLAGMK